jgi:hypothetical protein
LKLETYEAFAYDEVEDDASGAKEWVINLLEPTFPVHQELENLCRFDPYIMCRIHFKEKKWVAFYSDCGNVAKSRAFAFALIAFETAQADQRDKQSTNTSRRTSDAGALQKSAKKPAHAAPPTNMRMIQLARTRECLVCAEYDREHSLPWQTLADDKDAFEERLAQMVAMQQASSSRPGGSARAGTGRGNERAITFDPPVDCTGAHVKKPKPVGCAAKFIARISGTRIPHENRMGDPDFIMSQQARPIRRGKTKLYDKEEQTQRDFDALYKLANTNCRPTSMKVPCRRTSRDAD